MCWSGCELTSIRMSRDHKLFKQPRIGFEITSNCVPALFATISHTCLWTLISWFHGGFFSTWHSSDGKIVLFITTFDWIPIQVDSSQLYILAVPFRGNRKSYYTMYWKHCRNGVVGLLQLWNTINWLWQTRISQSVNVMCWKIGNFEMILQ